MFLDLILNSWKHKAVVGEKSQGSRCYNIDHGLINVVATLLHAILILSFVPGERGMRK